MNLLVWLPWCNINRGSWTRSFQREYINPHLNFSLKIIQTIISLFSPIYSISVVIGLGRRHLIDRTRLIFQEFAIALSMSATSNTRSCSITYVIVIKLSCNHNYVIPAAPFFHVWFHQDIKCIFCVKTDPMC